ncbi:helix-turn-helix transcriptional regulator [Leptotrichia massiliensis]|mgnify:FL=1|jgi:hypothetical protein|uniref:helix-turn-helix domain-containing protein n=1 Tax=Leptotrichia massiliensis TaxID=1852388 RepID=UPI0028D13E5B|nr:helix-turn-helix transcriptional regulator [Leptotrichia massiliensis]
MINKRLLKSKMVLEDKTQNDIAKLFGFSIPSINKRFNGKVKFKPTEIRKLKDYLNLTNDEVVEIFINE